MSDPFINTAVGYDSPAVNAVAITPADTDLTTPTRGVWVGGAGDVTGILKGDTVAVTFTGVPAGTLLPFAFKQIKASTTATLIIGVW